MFNALQDTDRLSEIVRALLLPPRPSRASWCCKAR
jgi:hypothetical protein